MQFRLNRYILSTYFKYIFLFKYILISCTFNSKNMLLIKKKGFGKKKA